MGASSRSRRRPSATRSSARRSTSCSSWPRRASARSRRSRLRLSRLSSRNFAVFASRNRHKARELEALLPGWTLEPLVLLAPDGRELRGTGVLEGRIAHAPRGDEGFGYDPIFIPENEERTVAELGNEWKAEHSHRARAARALLRALGDAPATTS